MSTAGPNSPSSFINYGDWTGQDQVYASDNSYATVTTALGNLNEEVGTFGFAIPTGATINGIQIDVEAKVGSGTRDLDVLPVRNGTTSGSATITLSTTEQYYTTGGASSLWGLAWTSSDVNASTFTVRIRTVAGTSTTYSVDHIRVTVTYTIAATGYTNLPLMGVG